MRTHTHLYIYMQTFISPSPVDSVKDDLKVNKDIELKYMDRIFVVKKY